MFLVQKVVRKKHQRIRNPGPPGSLIHMGSRPSPPPPPSITFDWEIKIAIEDDKYTLQQTGLMLRGAAACGALTFF